MKEKQSRTGPPAIQRNADSKVGEAGFPSKEHILEIARKCAPLKSKQADTTAKDRLREQVVRLLRKNIQETPSRELRKLEAAVGDRLLSSAEVAQLLGVETDLLEAWQMRDCCYGPKCVVLAPTEAYDLSDGTQVEMSFVRYLASDVREWLRGLRENRESALRPVKSARKRKYSGPRLSLVQPVAGNGISGASEDAQGKVKRGARTAPERAAVPYERQR